MLRIRQTMHPAYRAIPCRVCKVHSVEQDDFIVAVWEATSLHGPFIHHVHVSVITIIVSTVALACLNLFFLDLRYSVSFCLNSLG